MGAGEPLAWTRDGGDWPNRAASRFVTAGRLRWHVQVMGDGPALLAIHGTGGATHSWRDLAGLLAQRFTVVAPDLPGHGFTSTPARAGFRLPEMARAMSALTDALELAPSVIVGHSAGAAIAARMSLDGLASPRAIVGLAPAMTPFRGLGAHLFPPLAKLLTLNPFVPALFSMRAANLASVRRLIASTGSTIDEAGVDCYARLLRRREHVSAALAMMANWDLETLARDLPRLAGDLVLVVGAADRTVPPDEAEAVRALRPATRVVSLPGLGHLAHEERPDLAADAIFAAAGAAAP